MKIKIVKIVDRGIAMKERLHLSVLVDTNLVYYTVIDTKYKVGNQTIFGGALNCYWFDDHPVKAGDNVIIYSGPGTPIKNLRSDGGTNHFFYWGKSTTIWEKQAACAVLFELDNWQTSLPE